MRSAPLHRARWRSATFFERPASTAQGAGHRRVAQVDPGGCRPRRAVLSQGGIGQRLDLGQQRRLGLPPNAPPPTRSRRGGQRAGFLLSAAPAFDRAFADTKAAGRLSLREPGVDGSQQPLAEVGGVLLHAPTFSPVQLFRNALYYEATTHIADLFPDETDDVVDTAPHGNADLPPGITRLPIAPEDVPAAADPPWRLLEERRLDPNRPSHRGYRRTSDFRVSPTDPDASPMWDWGAIRLGYHDHYVVDGGKRRIILAALVTPADVMENQAMPDLLWRVCFRRKIWPHHATGDAKYGTTENIVALEDAGIRAYLPLTDFEHRSSFYGRDAFTYEADQDRYCCPEGHALVHERVKATEGVSVYRAEPRICNVCPVKTKCTTSDRGRIVHRSLFANYIEKVRGYHATEAYKKAIRKRQVWVEPLFAEAKEWHGLRRLRLRGLLNANIQGLLIAAGQNLKRFLAATGWGRRHAPCGSLLALPSERERLSAMYG